MDTALIYEQFKYTFEEPLLKEIEKIGVFKHVKENQKLINYGEYVKSVPLVLKGALKVQREGVEGSELFLYYLEGGDTCAMALTCCMQQRKSEVRVSAIEDTDLLLIPLQYMESWISRFPTWRDFVFQSFNFRIEELLETVDSIAFMNMDQRLLKHLRDKVKVTKNTDILATHQEIADELHTSRVVVSRLLKKMEKDGYISLHRNKITLLSASEV